MILAWGLKVFWRGISELKFYPLPFTFYNLQFYWAAWAGEVEAAALENPDYIINTTPAWRPVIEALKNLESGGRGAKVLRIG